MRFTENGQQLPLTDGTWKSVMQLGTYRQDFIDVPIGQAGGFVVLTDTTGEAVFSFRLKVVDAAVTEIETILCHSGEARFFAPAMLMNDPSYDTVLDPAARSRHGTPVPRHHSTASTKLRSS